MQREVTDATQGLRNETDSIKQGKTPLSVNHSLVFRAQNREAGQRHSRAALHPSESDVPPETHSRPLPNTVDCGQPFDGSRAPKTNCAALQDPNWPSSEARLLDNLLHHGPRDAPEEATIHAEGVDGPRGVSTNLLLGLDAVCGFVAHSRL